MRAQRIARVGVLMVVITFLTGEWVASADTTQQAKQAYSEGREHFKAGRYTEALAALKEAYRLKPHPALLRYMGDACFKLNNAKESIAYYKRYLHDAPQAADRPAIESKVRQLELVVGASDEDEGAAAKAGATASPAPAPRVARPHAKPAPGVDLAPTGEDGEVPLALRSRNGGRGTMGTVRRDSGGTSAIGVVKWIAAGVAVAGLATGITFSVMAGGAAGDLEKAAKNDCPKDTPNCGGNPTLIEPKVQFSKEHFDLQQAYKRNQAIGIGALIGGGVAAGAAVVLFLVDRPKRGPSPATAADADVPSRASRFALTPEVGRGYMGLAGELSF